MGVVYFMLMVAVPLWIWGGVLLFRDYKHRKYTAA
jgi:hypothetical protein